MKKAIGNFCLMDAGFSLSCGQYSAYMSASPISRNEMEATVTTSKLYYKSPYCQIGSLEAVIFNHSFKVPVSLLNFL